MFPHTHTHTHTHIRSRTPHLYRHLTQLKNDQVQLTQDLAELKSEVDTFITLGDLRQVDDRLATALDFEARLVRCKELSELYNSRETIFLLPLTEYPQVRR